MMANSCFSARRSRQMDLAAQIIAAAPTNQFPQLLLGVTLLQTHVTLVAPHESLTHGMWPKGLMSSGASASSGAMICTIVQAPHVLHSPLKAALYHSLIRPAQLQPAALSLETHLGPYRP